MNTIAPSFSFGNGSPLSGLSGQQAPTSFAAFFSQLIASMGLEADALSAKLPEGMLPTGVGSEDGLGTLLPKIESFLNGEGELLGSSQSSSKLFLKELSIEIETTIVELNSFGINTDSIGSVNDLADAYQALGLSREEALLKAERVDNALKAMRQMLAKEYGVELAPLDSEEEAPNLISTLFEPKLAESEITGNVVSVEMVEQRLQMRQLWQTLEQSSATTLGTQQVVEAVLMGQPLPETPSIKAFQQASLEDFEVSGAPLKANEHALQKANENSVLKAQVEVPLEEVAPEDAEIESHFKTPRNTPAESSVATALKEAVQDVTTKGASTVAVAAQVAKQEVERRAPRLTVVREGEVLQAPKGEVLFEAKPNTEGVMEIVEANVSDADEVGTVIEVEERLQQKATEEALEGIQRREGVHKSNIARAEQVSQMARQAAIVNQVNVQIKQMVDQGTSTVRMTLNPADLGSLEIQLDIADGMVKGTISVQNQEVAEQLARDLRLLQQGLADAGLELQKEGIKFLLRGEGEGEPSQQQGGNNSRFAGSEEEGENLAPWVSPDALLDVRV